MSRDQDKLKHLERELAKGSPTANQPTKVICATSNVTTSSPAGKVAAPEIGIRYEYVDKDSLRHVGSFFRINRDEPILLDGVYEHVHRLSGNRQKVRIVSEHQNQYKAQYEDGKYDTVTGRWNVQAYQWEDVEGQRHFTIKNGREAWMRARLAMVTDDQSGYQINYLCDPWRYSPIAQYRLLALESKLQELLSLDAQIKSDHSNSKDQDELALMKLIWRASISEQERNGLEYERPAGATELNISTIYTSKEIMATELEISSQAHDEEDKKLRWQEEPDTRTHGHEELVKELNQATWGCTSTEHSNRQAMNIMGEEEAESVMRIECSKVGVSMVGRKLTEGGRRRLSTAMAIYRAQCTSTMRPELAEATNRMMSGLVASLQQHTETDYGTATRNNGIDGAPPAAGRAGPLTPPARIERKNSDDDMPELNASDSESGSSSGGTRKFDASVVVRNTTTFDTTTTQLIEGGGEKDSDGDTIPGVMLASDSDRESTVQRRAETARARIAAEEVRASVRSLERQQYAQTRRETDQPWTLCDSDREERDTESRYASAIANLHSCAAATLTKDSDEERATMRRQTTTATGRTTPILAEIRGVLTMTVDAALTNSESTKIRGDMPMVEERNEAYRTQEHRTVDECYQNKTRTSSLPFTTHMPAHTCEATDQEKTARRWVRTEERSWVLAPDHDKGVETSSISDPEAMEVSVKPPVMIIAMNAELADDSQYPEAGVSGPATLPIIYEIDKKHQAHEVEYRRNVSNLDERHTRPAAAEVLGPLNPVTTCGDQGCTTCEETVKVATCTFDPHDEEAQMREQCGALLYHEDHLRDKANQEYDRIRTDTPDNRPHTDISSALAERRRSTAWGGFWSGLNELISTHSDTDTNDSDQGRQRRKSSAAPRYVKGFIRGSGGTRSTSH